MKRSLAGLSLALLLTGCGAGEPAPGSGSAAESAASPSASTHTMEETAKMSPTEPESEKRSKEKAKPLKGQGEPSAAEQEQLDADLRDAAWANDVDRAAELIKAGADVNSKDDTQQSAYLIATSEGYLDLLRLTLRHSAQVDDKDSWNGTGLIRAAERGHGLVVGELLQAGIDRDHINRIGYQAIHEAIWLGEDDANYATTVRALAAGGVELQTTSPSAGMTPLEMARSKGFDGAEKILTRVTGAVPANPERALLAAAESGDADGAALALRGGADLEVTDEQGRTPLLLAVTHDRVATAQLLVAMGADPDALDGQHDTPWLVTGVTGSVAMLETLLPARPDFSIVNRFGGLSPIPASERGHVEYVRRVAETSVDLDHVNNLGWTALLEAIILGDGGPRHTEIVQILLDAGVDRDIADADGVTPLEHAQRRGYEEMVALLRDR